MTDHGDDRDDDPALNSLRAVWLSMPDEDPPDRGLAELMAAARVKAEQMAQPSWWQRVFAVLRRPPVLALATVMVLIGGAVFIGKRSDKLEAPPPSAPEPQRQLEAPAVGSAAPVDNAPVETEKSDPKPEPPPDNVKSKVSKPASRPTAKPSPLPPPPPTRADKATGSTAIEADSPALQIEPTAGGLAGERVKESPATGAAPKTPLVRGSAASPAPDRGPAQAPVSQYFSQARSAATRGDCAAARVLAGRIAKQDAQYYRDVVVNDASVKKCLTTAAD